MCGKLPLIHFESWHSIKLTEDTTQRPGLKVHLYTNSVVCGTQLYESYKIRVWDLIRGSPKQPWNLAASPQQNGTRGSELKSTFPTSSPILSIKVKISGCFEQDMFQQSKPFIIPVDVISNVVYTSLHESVGWVRGTPSICSKVLNTVTIKARHVLTSLSPRLMFPCRNCKGVLPSQAEALLHIYMSHSSVWSLQNTNTLFESCHTLNEQSS